MEREMKRKENQSDEAHQVRDFVSDFFAWYYTERDREKVLEAFTDRVLFVGTGEEEVARSRERCREFVGAQMDRVPNSIPYFITDYAQNRLENGTWICFARVELNVVSQDRGTVKYSIRLTLALCREGERWKIAAAHVSEADTANGKNRTFTKKSEAARSAAQREIGRIMSQVVPGGIVSRYVSPGSPISIVNEEYLRMLGHPTFYDFMEACSGQFERNIHPEDLEKFLYNVHLIITGGKQRECEYRVQRSDGSYMWVHDMGRKAVSTDGRDLVVSVLTDMSDRVERRRQLERESETDELTAVCNRRGASNHYRRLGDSFSCYTGFILDVDNFKQVNDLYGHKRGDWTLRYVAQLLKEAFGETAIICRLGGDEFSVFLPDCSDLEGVKATLTRLLEQFRKELGDVCPEAGCSLSAGGVYGRRPLVLEQAFAMADGNLYIVKRDKKNGFLLTELICDS